LQLVVVAGHLLGLGLRGEVRVTEVRVRVRVRVRGWGVKIDICVVGSVKVVRPLVMQLDRRLG
jgi:hypothetical protein